MTSVTATPQLMLNLIWYQGSKLGMEFHMINILYVALSMHAQTEKTTFSCKDDCTLTKDKRCWTYSALWYFYFSPGTPWNTSGAILEQFWSHCCRILLWTLIQNKPLHVESLLLCFLLFMPLSFTLLTLYHLPIIQFYSRSWHSLHVCFVPSTICWKYWQSY